MVIWSSRRAQTYSVRFCETFLHWGARWGARLISKGRLRYHESHAAKSFFSQTSCSTLQAHRCSCPLSGSSVRDSAFAFRVLRCFVFVLVYALLPDTATQGAAVVTATTHI